MTDDDRVLALLPGDDARTRGERLPAEISAALDRAGVSRTSSICWRWRRVLVDSPGLRIGLAAVQGLAMTLNKPVAGVSALDALAAQIANADEAMIVPWMDASVATSLRR